MQTILIADDDPVMLKLYQLNLGRAGYRTVACAEGLGVHAKAVAEKPNLAILDYLLPGKTGLELIQDFRADAAWVDLPLIVITAQGKESTKAELMAAGANQVFTKPFSPTALVKSIQELLKGAEA